jgi:hypothetical protein
LPWIKKNAKTDVVKSAWNVFTMITQIFTNTECLWKKEMQVNKFSIVQPHRKRKGVEDLSFSTFGCKKNSMNQLYFLN